MLNKHTHSIDTNIYIAAAEKLGYTIQVLSAENSYVKISNGTKTLFLYENCLSINDQVAGYFSEDKFLSNAILSQVVPNFIPQTVQLLKNEADAVAKGIAFAEAHNFSVVIKPNNASLGIGVHLLPKDAEEVKQIVTTLFAEYSSVLVQQFLSAKNEYRIVYAEGQFFDAVHRIPAFITGDGTRSIEALIAEKNTSRSQFDFPLLELDANLNTMLQKSQLSLQSIVEKDKKVTLRNVCTFAQGGETQRVPQTEIHGDFLAAFEKVVAASRLRFIGIDLMCDDISQPAATQSSGINEINSAPMSDLHYFADLQENRELESTQRVLKMILG